MQERVYLYGVYGLRVEKETVDDLRKRESQELYALIWNQKKKKKNEDIDVLFFCCKILMYLYIGNKSKRRTHMTKNLYQLNTM